MRLRNAIPHCAIAVIACLHISAVDAGDNWLAQVRTASSSTQDLARLELLALETSAPRAARKGNELSLRTDSGNELHLVDSQSCVSPDNKRQVGCERNIFLGYDADRDIFLIFKALYEGGRWIVINATSGEKTQLSAFPEFSKRGTAIAVFKNDGPDGPDGMEVWERMRGIYVRRYAGVPSLSKESARTDSYSISTPTAWMSECAIAVKTETYAGSAETPTVEQVIIRRKKGTWIVESN